jgi:hypothetical protein
MEHFFLFNLSEKNRNKFVLEQRLTKGKLSLLSMVRELAIIMEKSEIENMFHKKGELG